MDKNGNVSQIFNKIYDFPVYSEIPECAFKTTKWVIPSMQALKIKLNNVKCLLSKYNLEEWCKHTRNNDPSSFITLFLRNKIQPELLTQAWCKFYECLSNFPLLPDFSTVQCKKLNSLHLCEAPGGFISALNHYLKLKHQNLEWDWKATTLNPDYEGNSLSQMIPDDRLYRHTQNHWFFGIDNTGDVTKYYNYLNLIEDSEKYWLITADGSIDCMSDPGNQETITSFLHYCETITALTMLNEGGAFVLKIFTMFEDTTICLLYLLNICFESIHAFKPCSSKGGNSEVYIICLNFKGLSRINNFWTSLLTTFQNGKFEESMFSLHQLPRDYLENVRKCADFFTSLQIETIQNNIGNFRKKNSLHLSKIHGTKVRVANVFLKKYKIKRISPECKLVPDKNINLYRKLSDECFVLTNYSTDQLISKPNLCLKYGKSIIKVMSSNFCSPKYFKNLNVFAKNHQDHFSLYNTVYSFLGNKCTIINRNDFDTTNCSNFQREFLNRLICTELRNDVLILDVPLTTTFLVGIFYILCSGYRTLYLHLSGTLILHGSNGIDLKSQLNEIKLFSKSMPDVPFSSDVIQVISDNLIYKDPFFHIVLNYNNCILSKFMYFND